MVGIYSVVRSGFPELFAAHKSKWPTRALRLSCDAGKRNRLWATFFAPRPAALNRAAGRVREPRTACRDADARRPGGERTEIIGRNWLSGQRLTTSIKTRWSTSADVCRARHSRASVVDRRTDRYDPPAPVQLLSDHRHRIVRRMTEFGDGNRSQALTLCGGLHADEEGQRRRSLRPAR
jgi:hypothetical protein